MGAEYPPVIIDGSNCIPASDDQQQAPALSMRASTRAGAASKLDPSATASLYLIRNNILHHEGKFRLSEVELICTDDDSTAAAQSPEAGIPLTKTSITHDSSGLHKVGTGAAGKVRAIRLEGRQEILRYGQDFHNFLLILQPQEGKPK